MIGKGKKKRNIQYAKLIQSNLGIEKADSEGVQIFYSCEPKKCLKYIRHGLRITFMPGM